MKPTLEQLYLMNVPTDRELKPGSSSWVKAQLVMLQERTRVEGALLTRAQAAMVIGCSKQNVADLVRRGRLEEFEIMGERFLSSDRVLGYKLSEASKGGRGMKAGMAIAA